MRCVHLAACSENDCLHPAPLHPGSGPRAGLRRARGTRRHVIELGRRKLESFLDPAEVNCRAFADQRARIERRGGERGLLDRMRLYFDYTAMSPEVAGRERTGAR